MFKNLKSILPSVSSIVYLLILPIFLVTYSLVVHYSARLTVTQDNIFQTWYLNQGWSQYVNRFTDFALWGGLAAIVLLAIWLVSASRTTVNNHYAEENFVNFNIPKNTWHSHFVTMIVVKIAIVFSTIFSLVFLIGQAAPLLVSQVDLAASHTTQHTVVLAIDGALLVIVMQYLIILCFKLFKFSHLE